MPAISFSGEGQRGPMWILILRREKMQTVRKPRKHPIKPGANLILYWKQRTPIHLKPIHKIGEAKCLKVDRVQYLDFAHDKLFAVKDGFIDVDEMQEWFGIPSIHGDEEFDVIHFDPHLMATLQCRCKNCGITWIDDVPAAECPFCHKQPVNIDYRAARDPVTSHQYFRNLRGGI